MPDLADLVQAHHDVYASVLSLAEELGDDDWGRGTGCPGWDVKDQLSHIVGLEALLVGDPYPEDHALPGGLGHIRDEVGRFMEVPVDARRGQPPSTIIAEARRVFAHREAQLAELSDLSETRPTFIGGEAPLYRSLPLRVFDMYAHEQDMRRATGRYGHEHGPAASISLNRAAKGLASVLPKRLDQDGTVVLRITGPTEATVAIDLTDGALDAPPAHPTALIELSFRDFLAAATGRRDGPGLEDVTVGGDRALAEAVLTSSGITP